MIITILYVLFYNYYYYFIFIKCFKNNDFAFYQEAIKKTLSLASFQSGS